MNHQFLGTSLSKMADNIPKKKVQTKRTIETIETIEKIENPALVRDDPKNVQGPLVGGSRSFRGGSVFRDVSFNDHPYLTKISLFLSSSSCLYGER